jgi:hypothetical protein
MSQYTYSKLDDDILYRLTFNPNNQYISSIYPPLRELITARHKQSEEFKARFHSNTIADRSYSSYISWTDQQDVYPSLHTVVLQVSLTSNYLNSLSSSYSFTPPDTDTFYPIAVRYTDNKNVWLIERPPFLANITFKNARSGSASTNKSYSIWMPWTLMLLQINPEMSFYEAHLFFNDGPLTSLDEKCIPCFFPNMYSNGRMCLNQTSIMLQQHLAQVDSFDISTIYNFILNDYMMGGWNTDLGIQAFDRCASSSKSALNARSIVLHGRPDLPKKYPSSLTPSGRISNKKYLPNFLNYFSYASLEEITSMITEAKTANKSYYNQTYANLIQEIQSNARSSSLYGTIFQAPGDLHNLYLKSDLYIDKSVDSLMKQNSITQDLTFEQSFAKDLLEFQTSRIATEIETLKTNSNHSYYNSAPPIYAYMHEGKIMFSVLKEDEHDKKFLDVQIPLPLKQAQVS